MPEKFHVRTDAGEVDVAGNKNAALPILAACLLTSEELLLHRVPRIRDTEAQIALLEGLGVEAEWVGDNSVRLCAAAVTKPTVDEELSSRIRASFLVAGPLLARFGEGSEARQYSGRAVTADWRCPFSPRPDRQAGAGADEVGHG